MSASLVLAAIPSPSSNAIEIGPLTVRAYGLANGVGVVTGAIVARRRGLPVADLLDVVAPAIPVAQALGRLGNWFNQELFGRPTDLPWALQIDPEHRPAGFVDVTTYHPAFLYEALWSVTLAGVRVNIWVSSIVLVAALALLAIRGRRGPVAPEALSCQQVARLLQSFLDREVDADTVDRIEEHLEQCRRCGMEAAVYREIKESLARATPAIPELTLLRLRHFGEELGVGVGGQARGSGL